MLFRMMAIADTVKIEVIYWLLRQLGVAREDADGRIRRAKEISDRRQAITEHLTALSERRANNVPLAEEPTLSWKEERKLAGRGFIYFIEAAGRGTVKIGFSIAPEERLADLQTSAPDKLILVATVEGDMNREKRLHKRFANYRLTGEWFRLAGDLAAYIESIK